LLSNIARAMTTFSQLKTVEIEFIAKRCSFLYIRIAEIIVEVLKPIVKTLEDVPAVRDEAAKVFLDEFRGVFNEASKKTSDDAFAVLRARVFVFDQHSLVANIRALASCKYPLSVVNTNVVVPPASNGRSNGNGHSTNGHAATVDLAALNKLLPSCMDPFVAQAIHYLSRYSSGEQIDEALVILATINAVTQKNNQREDFALQRAVPLKSYEIEQLKDHVDEINMFAHACARFANCQVALSVATMFNNTITTVNREVTAKVQLRLHRHVAQLTANPKRLQYLCEHDPTGQRRAAAETARSNLQHAVQAAVMINGELVLHRQQAIDVKKEQAALKQLETIVAAQNAEAIAAATKPAEDGDNDEHDGGATPHGSRSDDGENSDGDCDPTLELQLRQQIAEMGARIAELQKDNAVRHGIFTLQSELARFAQQNNALTEERDEALRRAKQATIAVQSADLELLRLKQSLNDAQLGVARSVGDGFRHGCDFSSSCVDEVQEQKQNSVQTVLTDEACSETREMMQTIVTLQAQLAECLRNSETSLLPQLQMENARLERSHTASQQRITDLETQLKEALDRAVKAENTAYLVERRQVEAADLHVRETERIRVDTDRVISDMKMKLQIAQDRLRQLESECSSAVSQASQLREQNRDAVDTHAKSASEVERKFAAAQKKNSDLESAMRREKQQHEDEITQVRTMAAGEIAGVRKQLANAMRSHLEMMCQFVDQRETQETEIEERVKLSHKLASTMPPKPTPTAPANSVWQYLRGSK
jgi:hypothetical protein